VSRSFFRNAGDSPVGAGKASKRHVNNKKQKQKIILTANVGARKKRKETFVIYLLARFWRDDKKYISRWHFFA
jgi:hypothetical protein